MLALTAIYLLLANLLLQTSLLRKLLNTGPSFNLEYVNAYSLWPGRVSLDHLTLRAEDANIELQVQLDAGVVDVSLHELFLRRFRALRVQTRGTSFRLRHKIQDTLGMEQRVAAYPPIPGFPDPPLFGPPKGPPSPGDDEALWNIVLENIDAELEELWMQEYRYVGPVHVSGGFDLVPGHAFDVLPTRLDFRGGAVSVGPLRAAERLQGHIDGHIERTDVETTTGMAILRSLNGDVELQVEGIDAHLVEAYLAQAVGVTVSGQLRLRVNARVSAGKVTPGSLLELRSDALTLVHAGVRAAGDLLSSAQVEGDSVVWLTSSQALQLANGSAHKPPVLERAALRVTLDATDLAVPAVLQHYEVEVPKLVVPSLGWANGIVGKGGTDIALGGRVDARGKLIWQSPGAVGVWGDVRWVGGHVHLGDVNVALGGVLNVDVQPHGEPKVSKGLVRLDLDAVEIGDSGDQRQPPFQATLQSKDIEATAGAEPRLRGTLQLTALPAGPLLGFLIGVPVLEELTKALLDLKRLDATAKLDLNNGAIRVELAEAVSGALTCRGSWKKPATGSASGAFLVRTSVANVGLSLNGSGTETTLFAPDDWLEGGRGDTRTKRPASGRPAAPARN